MKANEMVRKLSERDPQMRFRFDERLEVFRYLRGNLAEVSAKDGSTMRREASRFLKSNSDLFGKVGDSKMEVLQEDQEPEGGWNLTLQQYHGTIPVYGGSIRFHVNSKGVLDTVNNRLFPDLDYVAQKPRVTEERAVRAAQQATKCDRAPERKPELLVYRHEGKPRLVWEVRLNDTKTGERDAPAQWVVYVDAVTGKVLFFYDNVQTAGPVVSNGTGYYSGAGTVNAWFNDVTNQLRDTTRTGTGGPEIITNDEDGASPSADADSNWNDSGTSPRHLHQGPEVDAHRFAGDVADYFQTVHGRNSFNGAGASFITLVHNGTDFSNGFWNGSQVNLGDGTGVAATGDDYECSDDWLAHEFTHAYTQHTCNLQYANESGALNESFSDVFAAFITGDWLCFEDAWLKASAPAWRNMIDPTNGGQWDNSTDTNAINSVFAGHNPHHYTVRYTGAFDGGGVHVNSSIINHLFYLLTVGGTHALSGITVTGIGQAAAEQMLFRCMAINLVGNPTANFLDFREAMLDACLDLFPTDLMKLTQVKNAFRAVGIGPDLYVRDNLTDNGDEPFPGGYLWASPDIINRQSPAASPTTDFADMTNDSLWQNVEFGQANSIYIRVQNRGLSNGDATINVYFSSATTFGTPASWTHIGTLNEFGIAPSTVRIAGPLTFPAASIPAPGHYCMIAVISDGLDPAPDHTLISSVSDYLHFVRNTNNIAYRNMDVVNDVTGLPGTFEIDVRGMPRQRDRFELELDLGRFVPGAKIQVRGPRRALDGAIARGLKLVGRTKNENVYEPIAGPELVRHQAFLNHNKLPQGRPYGFEGLMVEQPFKLKVDYVLPEAEVLDKLNRRAVRSGYRLVARQFWQGEPVGAVGLAFGLPREEKKLAPVKAPVKAAHRSKK
jgi:thermolysin